MIMNNKGLDGKFLHYGIRKGDLEIIESLCDKYELDKEWVEEQLLKAFHERKVNTIEMSSSDVEQVVNNAIQQLVANKL